MKIKLGALRRILREEYCAVCGSEHDDHDGLEPYWHDDNDSELNPRHLNDPKPNGFVYKEGAGSELQDVSDEIEKLHQRRKSVKQGTPEDRKISSQLYSLERRRDRLAALEPTDPEEEARYGSRGSSGYGLGS